LALTKKGSIK